MMDDTGDYAGALKDYGKALDIRQNLADTSPTATNLMRELANTHNNIGVVQLHRGDAHGSPRLVPAGSVDSPTTGRREPRRGQVPRRPGENSPQHRTGAVGNGKNERVTRVGPASTRPPAGDGRRQLERDRIPANGGVRHHNIGNRLSDLGDKAGALVALGNALAIEQKLVDANPGVTHFQRDLVHTLASVAVKLAETGDNAGARAAFGKSLAVEQKLADAHPKVVEYRANLAVSAINFSEFLRTQHNPAEARDGYDRALAIVDTLVKDNPKNRTYQVQLAYALRGRGLARLDLGDAVGAAADTRRSMGMWEGSAERRRLGLVPGGLLSCHAGVTRRPRRHGHPGLRRVYRGRPGNGEFCKRQSAWAIAITPNAARRPRWTRSEIARTSSSS